MGFTRKITPEQRAEYERMEDEIAKGMRPEASKSAPLQLVKKAPEKILKKKT
jgi:hypothetical protein